MTLVVYGGLVSTKRSRYNAYPSSTSGPITLHVLHSRSLFRVSLCLGLHSTITPSVRCSQNRYSFSPDRWLSRSSAIHCSRFAVICDDSVVCRMIACAKRTEGQATTISRSTLRHGGERTSQAPTCIAQILLTIPHIPRTSEMLVYGTWWELWPCPLH